MTPQEIKAFDEAVEKVTGIMTAMTSNVDPQIMLMAYFKMFEKVIPRVTSTEQLAALSDDLIFMANSIQKDLPMSLRVSSEPIKRLN